MCEIVTQTNTRVTLLARFTKTSILMFKTIGVQMPSYLIGRHAACRILFCQILGGRRVWTKVSFGIKQFLKLNKGVNCKFFTNMRSVSCAKLFFCLHLNYAEAFTQSTRSKPQNKTSSLACFIVPGKLDHFTKDNMANELVSHRFTFLW